jgi:hypothetical protein
VKKQSFSKHAARQKLMDIREKDPLAQHISHRWQADG